MSNWKKRIVVASAGIILILAGAVAAREQLERSYVAFRICRTHIFTPPPAGPDESWARRTVYNAEFYWDFAGFHFAREKRLKKFNPELRPLVRELDRRQAAGEGMQYSMHIYREIRWLLNFTPNDAATRVKIEDLRRSLNEPDLQKQATEQEPADGSWGMGFDAWYLKLYYSVEDGLSSKTAPQYPLRFLDRINSPQRLTAQLDGDLYNDFTKTGTFNREELDETFSALARLLFGHKQTGYAFDPQLADALRAYVSKWQNPTTGCFGQWLVDRHGRIWKMDDTGITFHVVSDLHGNVSNLDRLAMRLIDLEGLDFPAGPRMSGQYENHLDWDMVKVFRYAWPSMNEQERAKSRAEIAKMLGWCLKDSLQPDGSFKLSELDDTVGDAYNYGVSFLADAGYFGSADRFWTSKEFPEAAGVRDRIEARIKSIGLNDPGLRDAYARLEATRVDGNSRAPAVSP